MELVLERCGGLEVGKVGGAALDDGKESRTGGEAYLLYVGHG